MRRSAQEAQAALLLAFVGGVILAGVGVLLGSDFSGFVRVVGWLIRAAAAALLLFSIVGYGVMYGVRAARPDGD